jgi:hypothetical protein
MAILDFGALIRELGSRAVDLSISESNHKSINDNMAIAAVMDQDAENRVVSLRKWIEYYKVFQGLSGEERNSITQAVLSWIDSREQDSRLRDLNSLLSAHTALANACAAPLGKMRNFTSLASKALWLRYPNEVPLYDRYAQQALCMLAKITPDLPRVSKSADSYEAFALVWRALYDRHASDIAAIPHKGYPYSVRIFDRILWILGATKYTVASALGMAEV